MKAMLWMGAALFAGIFYAVSNSISAKISVQEGFKAQFYQVPGLLTSCIIYFMYKIYKSVGGGKPWTSWIIDTYYVEHVTTDKKTDKKVKSYSLNKQVVAVVVVCGITDCIDNFLFIYAYDYSFKAGINFSVIGSMFALMPIIISITFYIKFGEKIHSLQIGAMAAGVLSVLMITFSKEQVFLMKGQTFDHELHPIWAVLMMITVLC